jgi:hypothetical protein
MRIAYKHGVNDHKRTSKLSVISGMLYGVTQVATRVLLVVHTVDMEGQQHVYQPN